MAQEESNRGFSLIQVIIFTFIASVFLKQVNKDLIFNFRILKKKPEIISKECGEYIERNSAWTCIKLENKEYFKYEIR